MECFVSALILQKHRFNQLKKQPAGRFAVLTQSGEYQCSGRLAKMFSRMSGVLVLLNLSTQKFKLFTCTWAEIVLASSAVIVDVGTMQERAKPSDEPPAVPKKQNKARLEPHVETVS